MNLLSLFFCFFACFAVASVQAIGSVQVKYLQVPGQSTVKALEANTNIRVVCLGKRLAVFDQQLKLKKIWPLKISCQSFWLHPQQSQAVIIEQQRLHIFNLQSGKQQFTVTVPGLRGGGFLNQNQLLLATNAGFEKLDLQTQERQLFNKQPVQQLFVSAGGQTALVARGKQVQLLSLPDLKVLSANTCQSTCRLQNVHFSRSGRWAVTQLGAELWGVRAGYPSAAILRNVQQAQGFPRESGVVITLSQGQAERRDFQIGRLEKVLLKELDTRFGRLTTNGHLILMDKKGRLLDIKLDVSLNVQSKKQVKLPTKVRAGALTATGQLMTVSEGQLSVNGEQWPGAFWAIETRKQVTWALQNGADGGTQLSILKPKSQSWKATEGLRTAVQLAVNHQGTYAAVWDDEKLVVISAKTGKRIGQVRGHFSGVRIAISPDGQKVFVFPNRSQQGAYMMLLKQVDSMSHFAKKQAVPIQIQEQANLQISEQGLWALSHGHQYTALYRAQKDQPFAQVKGGGKTVRFSPDGVLLAVPVHTSQGWRVDVIRVKQGQTVYSSPLLAQEPSFLLWQKQRLWIGAGVQRALNSITLLE